MKTFPLLAFYFTHHDNILNSEHFSRFCYCSSSLCNSAEELWPSLLLLTSVTALLLSSGGPGGWSWKYKTNYKKKIRLRKTEQSWDRQINRFIFLAENVFRIINTIFYRKKCLFRFVKSVRLFIDMFAKMLQIKDFPHKLFLFSFIKIFQTKNSKQSSVDVVYIRISFS